MNPASTYTDDTDYFGLQITHANAANLQYDRAGVNPAPTIGNIVGAYKSLVSKQCLEMFKTNCYGHMMGKLFQRNYYEHIIRNEKSYVQITNYILSNPSSWKDDMFYKQQ